MKFLTINFLTSLFSISPQTAFAKKSFISSALLRRITAVYNFDKSKDIPITHDARLIPIDVDIGDIFWKYIFSECKLLFYMI